MYTYDAADNNSRKSNTRVKPCADLHIQNHALYFIDRGTVLLCMSSQEVPPSSSQTATDVPEGDSTHDTQSHRSSNKLNSSAHTRPSYREMAVFGGLLVTYIAALIAIGIFRAVKWPLKWIQTHQMK